jgi:hypothetical protein
VRRNKKIQALQALCVVCVFDLCGARASLDADLVQRMRALAQEMDLSMKEVRETFLRVSRRLGLPKQHVGR